MSSLGDRLFTWAVNVVQKYVVPLGVKFRMRRRNRLVGTPSSEFQEKVRQLGIPAEALWWGPMTLFPRKAMELIKAIESAPPTAVLEIGSGSSTPILAALAIKYDFKLVSLENHGDSLRYVKSIMGDLAADDHIELCLAGFCKKSAPDGGRYRWYDIDLAKFGMKFDFVIIDGPMGTLVGREGGLPEVRGHLAKSHQIYLDDAQRSHEQACIRQWKNWFPELVVESIDGCPGMARMRLIS